MAEKKLFLIDGSAVFYRSYFAFIRNPLINSKGENTSATFGFLNTLFKLVEDERPEYLAVIFDTREPTFRHEIYPEYKATREKMPDEMAATFPRLIEALKTLDIKILEKDGYEADDLIATIARRYGAADTPVYILSGDKDLAQLVNDNIRIYAPGKSTTQSAEILDREGIRKKFGVYPEEIIDWLAMIGDKSDNVPGIPSVGEKTATGLLEKFGSIENIYKNLSDLDKPALREKIREHREGVNLSRDLIRLDDQVPLDLDLPDMRLNAWDQNAVEILLKDMEFNRLIGRSAQINALLKGESGTNKTGQARPPKTYHLVNEPHQLDALIRRLESAEYFAFDIETDSLDTVTARIAGISVAVASDEAYYIALNHTDKCLDQSEVLKRLRPLLENPALKKIGQNMKYDVMVLRRHDIRVKNLYFDTMIASFLVNPSAGQHNLDAIAREYLEHEMIPIEDIIGSGRDQKLMTDLPAANVYRYACEDAEICIQLYHIFKTRLDELELKGLFHNIEMPLLPVLIEMEIHGVNIDTTILKSMSGRLEEELKRLEKEIFRLAGREFNVNSPQQLGTILFDELEIHKEIGMRKPKRTKTGQYSTSEQVLERYHRHDLPRIILEFRKLNKLKNTYVDALPGLIHSKTGRIHTSFNQTVAATGRLSSVNPNLQNIPIRTEIGREMRRAFIPSRPDDRIVSADYSQIELRIMAHLSGDEKMRKSFEQDQDIHAYTAALIMNIPIEDVTPEQRRKAKEINFGIIYGMSKYGLSNRLDIPVNEAEQFIYEYFSTYPRIQEYMRETIAAANREGYVRTMMGRIRYLPQIHSNNRQLREFAERTSINTPIQGSAADLIKTAMIGIQNELEKRQLNSAMILQVHDELVFEVPGHELEEMKTMVREIMENAFELTVPLKVEIGMGSNWLEAH